jgi:UDP-N-acetylmuramoyl-tripeptide--D-alanyl-D-alanine ligase
MNTMEDLYKLYQQFPHICTDTRNIIPQSLFFCLKGENFDGNNFATQALEAGAAYVVTERQDLKGNPRCVVVDNSLKTLQQLARYHRQQLRIPVIGITGSNGKTTTKELVAAVLSRKYKTSYTQGNLNNHIGVPLTLLSITDEHQIAIVEMGANHPGEIADLCELSMPNYGLITNIGVAHIEGFLSKENIITTKKALYRSVIGCKGTLFVNIDDDILTQDLNYQPIITYATQKQADINGRVVRNDGLISIELFGQTVDTHLTGAYNLYNMLAAAAVGHHFGVSNEDICAAIAQYQPANHRSQVEHKGSNTIIADYYNANPTSMTAALHNLIGIEHPHKVAILGDMRELGSVSDEEHARIIQLCRDNQIETYFVGGEFRKHLNDHPHSFIDVEEANQYFEQYPLNDALILVKGSHSIHLDKLNLLQ